MVVNRIDNNSNVIRTEFVYAERGTLSCINGNNNLNNNNGRLAGIVTLLKLGHIFLRMCDDLYSELCTYENLELAFKKARKGKTLKLYVMGFEEKLEENLRKLQNELFFHIYKPKPLQVPNLR